MTDSTNASATVENVCVMSAVIWPDTMSSHSEEAISLGGISVSGLMIFSRQRISKRTIAPTITAMRVSPIAAFRLILLRQWLSKIRRATATTVVP